ncbi:hypothetical protein [Rubritalea marina]|uniref:hypothetical protein n=1 Tax=Rubritalea marina TaxID=361055 RepID=UPI0003738081|nr:hypothetical protein [Rubritalea marina]
MSLHAEISQEAKAALAAQQRVSTISSIIISILAVLLIGLLLYIISLAVVVKNPPELISYNPPSIAEEQTKKPKTQNNVQRKPTAPTPNIAQVISANAFDNTAIPEPDLAVTDFAMDFGADEEFEEDWSDLAEEDAGSWGDLPKSMKKRCSKEDRIERLLKAGGVEKSEDAVLRSLDHFKRTQEDNGGWYDQSPYPVAYTGMALLCYLGHCETPTSPEYGITVEKAISYLVNVSMKNEGRLGSDFKNKHWTYEHAICTYAIAEAYTLCSKQNLEIPNLEEAVRRSANYLIDGQDDASGGWGYGYIKKGAEGYHVDTSVSCWQLQAIKAAKYTGIEGIKKIDSSAAKGLKYLEASQRDSGAVHYTPVIGSPTMTGGAVLCWQQWGKGTRGPAKKGIRWIHDNITFDYNTADSDLYAHYYYGQALINVGGKYWSRYNELFRDSLINAQLDDGTYKQPADGGPINGVATTFAANNPQSIHYRTALATLMLEVYYRFLPGSATN